MKKTTPLQKIRRGAAWAFLPMHALDAMRNAGASLDRTRRMIRGDDLKPKVPEEDAFHLDAGKKLLAALDDHARFERMYEDMKWGPADLEGHLKTEARTHLVRLVALWFVVLLIPVAAMNFGFMIAVFDVASAAFLLTGCIRNTGFSIQLEDRALYSLKTMMARPDFWRRCVLTF